MPILTQLALGAFYNNEGVEVNTDDMSQEDIKKVIVIDLFIKAAERAKKANFDGIQIHAAHFSFLSKFISPLKNHRTDEYGGSTENRAKILVDILKGIKELNLGHISIKINSSDFEEEVNIPIALVGGIRSRKTMQNILDTTKIQIISLSRTLNCDPEYPKKMQNGDIEDSRCISCNGCYKSNCHKCVVFKKKK